METKPTPDLPMNPVVHRYPRHTPHIIHIHTPIPHIIHIYTTYHTHTYHISYACTYHIFTHTPHIIHIKTHISIIHTSTPYTHTPYIIHTLMHAHTHTHTHMHTQAHTHILMCTCTLMPPAQEFKQVSFENRNCGPNCTGIWSLEACHHCIPDSTAQS